MTGRIPKRLATLAGLLTVACLAVGVGTASAATEEVAYNNLNTVAATVNGRPNTDTYSAYSGYFASGGFGGEVEFGQTLYAQIASLTTQLDVFQCERGVYYSENCYTRKPNKKFKMQWTASIYKPGVKGELLSLITKATATVKLHYRPTTNITCPATPEGKGYGANCDVGGYLQTITFKNFSPMAELPLDAVILLSADSTPVVNVGLQASYKEFAEGEFVEEPAIGLPKVGSDPSPTDAWVNGKRETGWAGYQPVFEVKVKK
jgi:hypothetical protein